MSSVRSVAEAVGWTASGEAKRPRRRRQWVSVAQATLSLNRTRLGLALFLMILLVALVGPLAAPRSATEFVGKPFAQPSGQALLGTDYLGRDVLSRVLDGGLTVFGLAMGATAIGMTLGLLFGLVAAYANKGVDEVIMRLLDVVMAFPVTVLALLVVSISGPKPWLIVLAVGIGHAPRVARVARGAALEIVGADFVKASEALGVSTPRIILGDILPNISSPMLVEAGLRFAYSVAAIAALSFLGFGLQPPAADWGLMVNENRIGIATQPYAVLAPIVLISLLTIGICLMADGLSRAMIGIDRKVEI